MNSTENINKNYWDKAASSPQVNWHIAHTSADDEEFYSSGLNEIKRLFFNDFSIIPFGSRVIDLGCGKGRLIKNFNLIRPDCRIIGVDISPTMIKLCNSLLSYIYNALFLIYNGRDFDMFVDESIDALYTAHVLQHLPRSLTSKLLSEMYRIIKPEGILALHFLTRNEIQEKDPAEEDYRSIRYYTPSQLHEIFNSCFQNNFTILKEECTSSINSYFLIKKEKGIKVI